jgi:hypothetical protein
MAKRRSFLDVIDARPHVRASRFKYGRLRASGVPAILCGAAAIVLAAGAGAALRRAAVVLPDTLREARLLWVALRGESRGALPGVDARTI